MPEPPFDIELFRNGDKELHLPLKLLVAASNELPAQGEGLEALWDRFLIRILCTCVKQEESFYKMLLDDSADRSIAILRYLDDTLDMRYPISRELHRLYDYFSYEMNRIKIGRNKDELDKVRPMMIDLRDTFHAANKNCAEGRGGEVPPVGTQEAGG